MITDEEWEADLFRLETILRDLNLPRGHWVLNGSGVMTLHGLRRHRRMGDVDLFVATRVWFDYAANLTDLVHREPAWRLVTMDPDDSARRCDPPYLEREMYGIHVHLFHSWRRRGVGDYDPAFLIHNAEPVRASVNGRQGEPWPCIPLQLLLDWKREVGRDKDQWDVRLLEQRMGGAAL